MYILVTFYNFLQDGVPTEAVVNSVCNGADNAQSLGISALLLVVLSTLYMSQ